MTITTPDGFVLDAVFTQIPNSTKGIVFAHGMTVDKNEEVVFNRAESILNTLGFSTIRFDFRAHGKSSGNSITDSNISGELTDLEAVVDYLREEGITEIGLAGASFGGSISSLFAGNHPDQVRALCLMYPVLDYQACFFQLSTPWAKKTFFDVFERIEKYGYIETASTKFKLGYKFFGEMGEYNPCQALGNFQGPLFIAHSPQDSYIPFDHVQNCFEQLKNPQKKLAVIEGAEHGFIGEPHETEVANMIVNFFDKSFK